MRRLLILIGVGAAIAIAVTISPMFPLTVTVAVTLPVCGAIIGTAIARDLIHARRTARAS